MKFHLSHIRIKLNYKDRIYAIPKSIIYFSKNNVSIFKLNSKLDNKIFNGGFSIVLIYKCIDVEIAVKIFNIKGEKEIEFYNFINNETKFICSRS